MGTHHQAASRTEAHGHGRPRSAALRRRCGPLAGRSGWRDSAPLLRSQAPSVRSHPPFSALSGRKLPSFAAPSLSRLVPLLLLRWRRSSRLHAYNHGTPHREPKPTPIKKPAERGFFYANAQNAQNRRERTRTTVNACAHLFRSRSWAISTAVSILFWPRKGGM